MKSQKRFYTKNIFSIHDINKSSNTFPINVIITCEDDKIYKEIKNMSGKTDIYCCSNDLCHYIYTSTSNDNKN